jgi:hypothetical protein
MLNWRGCRRKAIVAYLKSLSTNSTCETDEKKRIKILNNVIRFPCSVSNQGPHGQKSEA